jgi:putative FmdB family regulatory protein
VPLYEYACPAGHKYEALRAMSTDHDTCTCGQRATRLSVYRVGFSGFAPTPVGRQDFREDYRRFDEATQQLAYQKERAEDSAQQRFADPPLARMAEQKFKALERAGVNADNVST